MNTIKTWQERMEEYYSEKDTGFLRVRLEGYFKDAEIAEWRALGTALAAKEQREAVAWPEPVAFGPYSGLYSKEQVQQCIEAARTEMISAAVNRFLCWQLPKDFNPDCGISFDGRKDDEFNKNKTWPVGTNLLHAGQAKAMFEHCLMLATPPAAPVADAALDKAIQERDHYHDTADKLAEAIAEYFGADIGEHSGSNCPWDEALRVIEEAAPVADGGDAVRMAKLLQTCTEANVKYHCDNRTRQITMVFRDSVETSAGYRAALRKTIDEFEPAAIAASGVKP